MWWLIFGFYVDETPIRVFKNKSRIGVNYPSQQMHIKCSIWNGEPCWREAPFMAKFQGFNIHGCQYYNKPNKAACYSPHLWWNQNMYWELNSHQQRAYEDVRNKYLFYDYCSDRGMLQKECKIK
ncbi:hypothetical protein Lal_00037970 [Lupinus albus]|nr:hypothetical protein Lal_00037970 [Lupinus albus]